MSAAQIFRHLYQESHPSKALVAFQPLLQQTLSILQTCTCTRTLVQYPLTTTMRHDLQEGDGPLLQAA